VECSSVTCWAWPKSGKKELRSYDLGLRLQWGKEGNSLRPGEGACQRIGPLA
jgi:hypothetical protein